MYMTPFTCLLRVISLYMTLFTHFLRVISLYMTLFKCLLRVIFLYMILFTCMFPPCDIFVLKLGASFIYATKSSVADTFYFARISPSAHSCRCVSIQALFSRIRWCAFHSSTYPIVLLMTQCGYLLQ